MRIDDEMLMAFADGELSVEDALEIERAIAMDEIMAAKVAMFVESKSAAKKAFAALPPVSLDLETKIRAMAAKAAESKATEPAAQSVAPTSNVIDFASRRRTVPLWQLPLAAALALAVGVGAARFGTQSSGLQMAALDNPAITTALGTVASGNKITLAGNAEFTAIATFRDGDGTVCREFKHDHSGGTTMVAVACHIDKKWDIRFAVAAAPDTDGYAPASSLETLD
ncbi:MAG: anti-sigma factor family protein, partial [Notoacmeibacter sp.]